MPSPLRRTPVCNNSDRIFQGYEIGKEEREMSRDEFKYRFTDENGEIA